MDYPRPTAFWSLSVLNAGLKRSEPRITQPMAGAPLTARPNADKSVDVNIDHGQASVFSLSLSGPNTLDVNPTVVACKGRT
jgi:hypothetical protein